MSIYGSVLNSCVYISLYSWTDLFLRPRKKLTTSNHMLTSTWLLNYQSHSKWPVLLLNRGRLLWPSNWKPIEFAFKTESIAGLHFKGTPRSVQSVPYFILPIIEHSHQLRLLCSEDDIKAKLYLYDTSVTKLWSLSWRRVTKNSFSYWSLPFIVEVKISLSNVKK